MREEDGSVKGVGRGRVQSVAEEENEDHDEGIDPGMGEGKVAPSPQQRPCFAISFCQGISGS